MIRCPLIEAKIWINVVVLTTKVLCEENTSFKGKY